MRMHLSIKEVGKSKSFVHDSMSCRESLLVMMIDYVNGKGKCIYSVEFDNFNKSLIDYVAKKSRMVKKFLKNFETTTSSFSFTSSKKLERKFAHIISFLCLLNDQSFGNITTVKNCKTSDKTKEKTRKEISDEICNVFNNRISIRNFDVGNRASLCGYTKIVIEENKIVEASQYCNGPRSAYDYRKL